MSKRSRLSFVTTIVALLAAPTLIETLSFPRQPDTPERRVLIDSLVQASHETCATRIVDIAETARWPVYKITRSLYGSSGDDYYKMDSDAYLRQLFAFQPTPVLQNMQANAVTVCVDTRLYRAPDPFAVAYLWSLPNRQHIISIALNPRLAAPSYALATVANAFAANRFTPLGAYVADLYGSVFSWAEWRPARPQDLQGNTIDMRAPDITPPH